MICLPDCALCRHSYIRSTPEGRKKVLACAAFPDGVPVEIIDTAKKPGCVCASGIGYEANDKQLNGAEGHETGSP